MRHNRDVFPANTMAYDTYCQKQSFTTLAKCSIPTQTRPPIHLALIYQNKLPHSINRYFTNMYLFCLHKDPTDSTKLCPLGISTTIQRLIASQVAHTLEDKLSSHHLPFHYAVGVPGGLDFVINAMQLSIEHLFTSLTIPQTTHMRHHLL